MEENNYLSHHGIKGQKWGLRRFQNPDGSLTEEGRRRRGLSDKKDGPSLKKLAKRAQEKSDAKKAKAKEKKAETEAQKHENLKKYVREHPSKLYKHRTEFSQDEIAQIVSDINLDRRLKDAKKQEFQRTMDDVRTFANNLGTIKNVADQAKGIYNLAVEVNNTLIDSGKMNGKKLLKIGEKPDSSEDRSAFDAIVRSGDAEKIKANFSKMTQKEIENAMKNINYKEKLDKMAAEAEAERKATAKQNWYEPTSSVASINVDDIYKSVGSSDGSKAGNWYRPDSYTANDWYTPSVGEIKVSDILTPQGPSSGSNASAWYRTPEPVEDTRKKKK